MTPRESNLTLAVFLDLENIARGAVDARFPQFDIGKVLERLLVKGNIVVKKAYCARAAASSSSAASFARATEAAASKPMLSRRLNRSPTACFARRSHQLALQSIAER
jgi:hypothetical protein